VTSRRPPSIFDKPPPGAWAATPSPEQLLAQATALHQQGQWPRAEALYREVLRRQPAHPTALHRLGVLAMQTGHVAPALSLLEQARAGAPDDADLHSNLGLALHAAGRLDDAVASFERALALQPGFAAGRSNLGRSLQALGRHAEALACFDHALVLQPGYLEAQFNRGNALHALGRFEDALASYDTALAGRRDIAEIHVNRARVLHDLGRHEEALAAWDDALRLQPAYPAARLGRGVALLELGRDAPALAELDRAQALQADPAAVAHNRGNALLRLHRAADALPCFDRALALRPADPETLLSRANALQALRQPEAALASVDAALALAPGHVGARFNRGAMLLELKRYDEAADAFAQVLDTAPATPWVRGKLAYARTMACDWRDLGALREALGADIAAGRPGAEPFGHAALCESPAEQRRCAEIYAALTHPAVAAPASPARPGSPAAAGRLRVGYLCGEFRNQATAILMTELWEQHDRDRFHLVAFDNGWDDGSTLRQRIVAAFEEVVDIATLSDDDAAAAVAARGIDVLVNLNGYFGLGRNGVFARRPAPVQVNYLGFPGTIGAPWMDYLLADAVVIPPAQAGHYSEAIAWLPGCYQPNDRQRAIAATTPERRALGLPDDGVVFCCFNNTYKILPPMFEIWVDLLRQTPGSVLWLLDDNADARRRLIGEAVARGVGGERLVFAPRIRLDEHLARQRQADLFLDTLPYNAHTTASDALWAGLPLLTCTGGTFPGRVATSLLKALGLDDALVTSDLAAYRQRALELAHDPAARAALRARLASALNAAPLFDTPRLAREIESAFATMHRRAADGLPPAEFHVPAGGLSPASP